MFALVKILFIAFLKMCVLKKNPQDIPAHKLLLIIIVLLNLLPDIGFYFLVAHQNSCLGYKLFVNNAIGIPFLFLFYTAILSVYRKSERWLQTVTAILGTELIFKSMQLLNTLLLFENQQFASTAEPIDLSEITLLPMMLYLQLAVGFWNIVVSGHILRHALEIRLFFACLFVILYVCIRGPMIMILSVCK